MTWAKLGVWCACRRSIMYVCPACRLMHPAGNCRKQVELDAQRDADAAENENDTHWLGSNVAHKALWAAIDEAGRRSESMGRLEAQLRLLP